ncbi:MAG: hypothetical protein HKM89_09795, partial [Gemmatimonadales bacterium]|nr:hypothetical protein [Gemmatimonadales bacterium]
MAERPTPFELLFGDLAGERFPQIRDGLETAGQTARDRDVFLLNQEVVTLLRELRPEEGMGEAIDQLVGLVHHAYLMWEAGVWTFRLTRDRGLALLGGAALKDLSGSPPSAYYLQWPARSVWAQIAPEEPHEPLDGWFVSPGQNDDTIRVLGIFGLHPERMGFSVVEVMGARPAGLVRPDGTPPFASVLPAGDDAGLYSLVGTEELLELAWR